MKRAARCCSIPSRCRTTVRFSGRKLEEQHPLTTIAVDAHKRNPLDKPFVLKGLVHHGSNGIIVIRQQDSMGTSLCTWSHKTPPLRL